jgi:hypothetical protein
MLSLTTRPHRIVYPHHPNFDLLLSRRWQPPLHRRKPVWSGYEGLMLRYHVWAQLQRQLKRVGDSLSL